MADTLYAWSNIVYGVSDGKNVTKAPGDKVAKSDFLNIDKEDWQQMLDNGAVRTEPYPVDLSSTANPISPVEAWRQKIQEMEETVGNTSVAMTSSVTATPGVAAVEEAST